MTPDQLTHLDLAAIKPSTTHVQRLRRERFDAAALLELAHSIRENGVLQPILVRTVDKIGSNEWKAYELVAGERRWIAADRAGLTQIPCVVRDMTDAQVLEAQLVENLQREGLHALEEAEGYRELMTVAGLNADTLADKIGRSRSYVYARLKLLDLCAEARDALNRGDLDTSKALILARIPGEKMQTRALKIIAKYGHLSYRNIMQNLASDLMVPVSAGPWLPDRDDLRVPVTGEPAPVCEGCPNNSDSDPELQAAIGGGHCTDRACHDLKTKWHWHRLRKELLDQGRRIVPIDEAPPGDYLDPDEEVETVFPEPEPVQAKSEPDDVFQQRHEAWEERQSNHVGPTLRELIDPAQIVYAEDQEGRLKPRVPRDTARAAIKAKGLKLDKWSYLADDDDDDDDDTGPTEAERRAQHEKELQAIRVERQYRARLMRAVYATHKGPLGKDHLASLAAHLVDQDNEEIYTNILHPGDPDNAPQIDTLTEHQLAAVILIHIIAGDYYNTHNKPEQLLAEAARLKIDPKAIRAQVVKDLKPTGDTAGAKKGDEA